MSIKGTALSATVGSTAVTARSVTLPAGIVTGDYLVIATASNTAGQTATISHASAVLLRGPDNATGAVMRTYLWGVPLTSADSSATVTVTWGVAGRIVLVGAVLTGQDASTILTSTVALSSVSTLAMPAITDQGGDTIEIGLTQVTSGTAPTITLPGVYSADASALTTLASGSNCSGAIGVATGAGGGTASTSPSANRISGYTISFAPSAAPPSPGTVTHMWTGGLTATGFKVNVRMAGATSVRLAVSTASNMASPAYISAQTPDTYGYVRFSVTGISNNTRYYVQAADTPSGGTEALVGTIGSAKTLATGVLATRTIALGSCVSPAFPNALGIANANTWNPDYGIFTGDFFYNGDTSTTESTWVEKYSTQLNVIPGLKEFVSKGLSAFECVSDHDTMPGDNGDSNGAQAPYEQSAWRKVVPFGSTGASDVRDQQWNDGRIGFYMLDVRSPYRSAGTSTDDSSKTMLGLAQRARLFDWLENNSQPFKVIVCDAPWMGTAETVTKPDAWWSYGYERNLIATTIQSFKSDPSCPTMHVELWHGDSHLNGYATAAKNTWGNFPIICASPYGQDGGGRNSSTYSDYFNNGSGDAQQYGRITFTDNGQEIVRTFSGWDAITDSQKVSFVTTLPTTNNGYPAFNGAGDPVKVFYIDSGGVTRTPTLLIRSD